MPAKAKTLSDNDLRILQGMIDREKRQIINSPPMHVTERWDSGEDHQAPETYVAYPKTSAGIPARSGDEPGEAECDIYAIYGRPPTLTAVGRSQTVYNLQTSTLGQSHIPVSRDKYGKWLALVGGSGSGHPSIDFEVYAWVPDDALTVGCESVYAVVTRVSCGASVQVGDEVVIYDRDLCWFNIPADILIGTRGWAMWMESDISPYPGDPDFCLNAPTEGECFWIVRGICCREEVYASE